jgi:deoxyhypusine synthase
MRQKILDTSCGPLPLEADLYAETKDTIFLSDADLIDEKAQRILDLITERDRLREALEWYEKTVGDCNRDGKEGDNARNALAQDVGKRARAALAQGAQDET